MSKGVAIKTCRDIIKALPKGAQPVSARDVAEVAGCSTNSARAWLEALAEAGVLESRQRGFTGKHGVRPMEYRRSREWGGPSQ